MGSYRLSLFVFSVLFATASFGADCSDQWEEFSSEPYHEIALPDTSVKYWRYRFELPAGAHFGLRVSGSFPKARYMNFNVYDQNTMDSSASLSDFAIKTDEKSPNDYRLWVVPAGQKSSGEPNTLEMPRARREAQLVELWYREYLPKGKATLPRIESVDLETKDGTACPKHATTTPPLWKAIGNLPPQTDKIWFFAPNGHAVYSNPDNEYIASRLYLRSKRVAVIRVKVPRAKEDVRYWSFCIGGITTLTAECFSDETAPVDSSGYLTVVVGPEELRKAAQSRKLGFLATPLFRVPILIYRNLLTNAKYPGNLKKVPFWPGLGDPDRFAAHKFVAEYGPQGSYCDFETVKAELDSHSKTLCGQPVAVE